MTILWILALVLGILSPKAADSSCTTDLGLVVDTTRSLGYKIIETLNKTLSLLVQSFDIAQDKTHVSVETFNKKAQVLNKFNDPKSWSVNAIAAIVSTLFNKLRSPTRLDYALEEANGTMFHEGNGYRPGERKVLVVFTDGRTHDSSDLQKLSANIEDLKSKGVRLFAVAIGPDSTRVDSQRNLKEIGGVNVFVGYPSVDDLVNDVVDRICRSSCMPDLGLVADTTRSLKEAKDDMKTALALVVQQLDIAGDKTHVSLETFNKNAKIWNKFNDPNYWSEKAITDLINTSIAQLKSPTRLDYALEKVNGTMFTKGNGDRPGERNVLVVFTDGRTHQNTDLQKYSAYIKDLKNRGVTLVAVGIGDDANRIASQKALQQIGGAKVFYVDLYPSINYAMNEVVDWICVLTK